MSPITIRQLRYFAAVYEEANFSKAAEREHCSQPALSAQIRNLEGILNRRLFDRTTSGVVPTAAGEHFYRHSIAILRSINAAELEIAEMSGIVGGLVRAGLIPSIVRGLLPSFLPEFVDAHPTIDVRVIQGFSDTLAQAVLDGEVDFAVILNPPRHEGLDISKFADCRMVLISNPALGLSPGEPLRLSRLGALDLVVPSPNHTLRRSIEQHIWTKEIRIGRRLEMDTVHGMIDFVRHAKWSTLLPLVAVACDIGSDRLCINPVVEPVLEADLYLMRMSQTATSAAADLLITTLRQHAQAVAAIALA
jgi:LysR family transcriptional regulator, nitrogen assimilation regulatory protein